MAILWYTYEKLYVQMYIQDHQHNVHKIFKVVRILHNQNLWRVPQDLKTTENTVVARSARIFENDYFWLMAGLKILKDILRQSVER